MVRVVVVLAAALALAVAGSPAASADHSDPCSGPVDPWWFGPYGSFHTDVNPEWFGLTGECPSPLPPP